MQCVASVLLNVVVFCCRFLPASQLLVSYSRASSQQSQSSSSLWDWDLYLQETS